MPKKNTTAPTGAQESVRYEVWRHRIIAIPDDERAPLIVSSGHLMSRHRSPAAAERAARQQAGGCLVKGPSHLGCVREGGEPRDWFALLSGVTIRGNEITARMRAVRLEQPIVIGGGR